MESGFSMFTSSLTAEEPRGINIGGGVRMRSSNVFQNPKPPELRIAWLVKVLEDDRRLIECSLLTIKSSGLRSRESEGVGAVAWRLGDEAVVVG